MSTLRIGSSGFALPASARPAAAPKPPAGDSEEEIGKAASQFESLLIGQLLRGMKSCLDGGLTGEPDQAGATMMDFAEEHLATTIANGGGLGLAKLIVSGLRKKEPAHSVDLPLKGK